MEERDLYRASIIREVFDSLSDIAKKYRSIYGSTAKTLERSLGERKEKRIDELKKLEK